MRHKSRPRAGLPPVWQEAARPPPIRHHLPPCLDAEVIKAPEEKHIGSKAPVEKNIVPEALTKTPTENNIFDNAGPEELIKPKVPVEEHIVTKQ